MNTQITSKKQIFDKAKQLAENKGLDSISIREIAEGCNIAVGAVYYYFKNKDEILLAIVEEFWSAKLKDMKKAEKGQSFLLYVEYVFATISEAFGHFRTRFLVSLAKLNLSDKEKGRATERTLLVEVKELLLYSFLADDKIVFVSTSELDVKELVEFVYDNVFNALRKRSDIKALNSIIKKIIY